jgi:carboxyl-terminal processing protease
MLHSGKYVRSLAFTATLLGSLFSATVFALAAPSNDKALAPTREQSIATIEIVKQLTKRHYLDIDVNDTLSSKLFDRYMTTLDLNKNVLLQSDVKEFEQYRTQLDDAMLAGNLDAGFQIFNRYRDRLTQRLRVVVRDLPTMVKGFDFTKDEYLEEDREHAPWPKDDAEAAEQWRLRIKAAVLNLRLAGKQQDKIIELLQKRFKNQLSRIEQLNSEDAYQLYMNTLTQLFDPHTNYLSPANSENFNINMSLRLEGIGAVLQREDDYTKVVRLVTAGPAEKQGQLRPSDRIVSVGQGENGEMVDVIGWRLDDVVNLIRGPKASTVRLEIIPVDAKSDQETRVVKIVRDTVKLEEQSAKKEVIEILDDKGARHKVGVINIPTFYIDFEALRRRDPDYKSTTRDVSMLLNELMQEQVEGIIIDLRDNGGGSLKEANDLTSLFIDYGPTVQIRNADERIFFEQKMISSPYYDGPMVVLINRLSASASEIFAGAMQDYQRAIILGGQSFGKGTVQSLSPLRHGQLKLTESKFYRISGDSTQHRGVVPDIDFPSIYDVTKVGESALDDALPWDQIDAVRHRVYYSFQPILPTLKQKHDARMNKDPDFQYLIEQTKFNEQNGEQKRVSLNEAKRKQEETKLDTERLALENKRRAAKGMPKLNELEKVDLEEEEADAAAAEDKKKKDDDIFLREAGSVLVDTVQLMTQPPSPAAVATTNSEERKRK